METCDPCVQLIPSMHHQEESEAFRRGNSKLNAGYVIGLAAEQTDQC